MVWYIQMLFPLPRVELEEDGTGGNLKFSLQIK
jgi:hypothetical protein